MRKSLILFAIILLFLLIAFIFKAVQLQLTQRQNVVCTQEAKVCPDGSYVGRVPPNCDFAACPASSSSYEQKMSACHAIPNNSVKEITETTRVFINLPKDIYPDKDRNLQFKTISGDATAGWISNAGPYGEAFESNANCWSYYYEFDGVGEIDLFVKSAVSGAPDYSVKFIVSKNPADITGVLSGKVSIGPLCPVEPCKTPIINNPYSSRQLILTSNTGLIIYVKLNNDGSFNADVAVGNYQVNLSDCAFLGCSRSLPKNISIEANKTTTLNIDIDTGIR